MAAPQKKVKIGDYTVIQKLGTGGFSNVYQAVDSKGKFVAIKVPHPHIRQNEKIRQKINDEVVSMSRLNHPNITKLYRFLYPCNIVMEYIEGRTLKDCLDDRLRSLSFEQKIKLSKQAIDAFHYAYEMGVLHRDIKSANLMIDRFDNVKVMDFGIAKISSSGTSDTAAQMLSFQYASPERYVPGKNIDVRSDIYSFGVVLYELFSGKKPFDVEDTQQLIYCHLNEKPQPLDTSILPSHINTAVMKALKKDQEQRFETFEALGKALLTSIEDYVDTADKTQFITSLYKTTELVEALETLEKTVEDSNTDSDQQFGASFTNSVTSRIEQTSDSDQQFGASFTNSVTSRIEQTSDASQKDIDISPKVDPSSWDLDSPEDTMPKQTSGDSVILNEKNTADRSTADAGSVPGQGDRRSIFFNRKILLASIIGLILIVTASFAIFHSSTR